MLSWFTDDATFPVLTGFFLVVALLGLAAYSREKIMLYGAIIAAMMCVVTLVIETVIVTDKERVTNTLYEIQQSIRDNDFEKTFTYIIDEDTINVARQHTTGIRCEQCTIINAKNIEIDYDANPKTAVADFPVYGKVNKLPNPFTLRVILDLQEDANGQWKMLDYQLIDARSDTVLRTSK